MVQELHTLTSFRFLAALWVVLFHLQARIQTEDNFLWSIVDNGARGGDFFFILSGFVIFHVYEKQIIARQFSFRRFIIKRIARIYPLHLALLLVFVAIALFSRYPLDGLFQSVFLLHAFGTTDGLVLNGPSWTISAEFFAYLLFALVVFRSPRTWVLIVAFVFSFAAAHLVAVSIERPEFLHLTWDYGHMRILPLFVLGMLLRRLMPLVSISVAYLLAAVGLVTFVFFAHASGAGYELLIPFSLLIVAGARLSEVAMLPTNARIPVYLGEISYSVYLVHILALRIYFEILPRFDVPQVHWGVLLLAIIAASSVSYHCLEQPARRWVNKFA